MLFRRRPSDAKPRTRQGDLPDLTAVVDALPDGVVVVDGMGRIMLVNEQASKLFGYPAREIIGRDVEILVPAPLQARHRQHRQGYMERPQVRPMGAGLDLRGRRKDGAEFPVDISLAPLETSSGPAAIAAIRDATHRRKAEERTRESEARLAHATEQLARYTRELERSNKELEHFAYVASHDLQEPLRMVSSYTGLLGERYRGRLDAEADEFIGYAVDGAQRMRHLIDGLLEYSRVSTRAKPATTVRADAALDQALANLRGAIAESGAAIEPGDLPTVTADRDQLVAVFQNLLSNAIKFRSKDRPPRVLVSAERENNQWVFAVTDNGIGIDPRDHDRIFLLFNRLHSRDEYPGTGLGLALVKKIVERQGGRVWLESSPGQGSTFRFSLPVEGPPATLAVEPAVVAEAEVAVQESFDRRAKELI